MDTVSVYFPTRLVSLNSLVDRLYERSMGNQLARMSFELPDKYARCILARMLPVRKLQDGMLLEMQPAG